MELGVKFKYDEGEAGGGLASFIFCSILCCTLTGSTDIHDILELPTLTFHKFHKFRRGLRLEPSVMKVILYETRR